MGSDMLFKFFCDDFTRSYCDCTTHEVDDARSSIDATSKLKHADSNVESGASATGCSIALFSWPRIWLQVIKDRVKGELTLVDWYEESSERV